jgi:predicted ester cyclase
MRPQTRAIHALILFMMVLVGVSPVLQATAQEASPAASMPCPAANEAETEALARRFVTERFVNPAIVPELLAPEVEYHRGYTTTVWTTAQAQANSEVVHTAFPDVQVMVARMIVKDDTATVIWIAEATHLGALQPWGVLPTGQHATWEGISVVRVACGRIVEVWNEYDYLDLLNQLSIVSDEELADAELTAGATPTP